MELESWYSLEKWKPWGSLVGRRNGVNSYSRALPLVPLLFIVSALPPLWNPSVSESTTFQPLPGPITSVARLLWNEPSGASDAEILVGCPMPPTCLAWLGLVAVWNIFDLLLAAANVGWNAWNYWVFTMLLGGDFKLNIMFCLVCGVTEDFLKAE